ncbi:MAG: hypothetical protein ABSG68_21685 [Thermoguttaceae bacterium]|jgi:hypothetical protein
MLEERREDGRRGSRSPSGRRPWQFSLLSLFVLMTLCAVLLSVFKSFPLETLFITALFVVAGVGIVLYIGELVVIGWVVDFLWEIGMPHARPVPLEFEQVGEIIVVKLRDNIGTVRQCQTVQKQLKGLIDEHHCDFVLDFFCAGNISRRFRGVMVHVMKAARREAEQLGKPYRPVALPRGELFRVFDGRQRAVEEMSKHDGHGWVVLCSVPVGIRAVS